MHRRSFLGAAAAAGLTAPGTARAGLPAGFHVPPEDARHEATFMMWPASVRVYGSRGYVSYMQKTIARIANTIAAFEPVILLADKSGMGPNAKHLSDAVEVWNIPTEDLWARDAGPLVATGPRGQRVVSHIRFNGWGGKQVHKRDGQVAHRVAEALDMPLIDSGLQGEPGGVDHDGHGLIIAHESSWVIANRNPGLGRDEVEARLLAAFGATRMIWAKGLKAQDITDYHIDSLARFSGPGRVLINLPDDPDMTDPFFRAAFDTHDVLAAAGLEITVIPEPNIRRVTSYDFVASYANYYACNGAVIAAQFGDPETDAAAVRTLAAHHPGREVVTLNVDALGEVGGGIHCATQQLPAI